MITKINDASLRHLWWVTTNKTMCDTTAMVSSLGRSMQQVMSIKLA